LFGSEFGAATPVIFGGSIDASNAAIYRNRCPDPTFL